MKKYNLNDLLGGITEDNLHSEINCGKAVGNEIDWESDLNEEDYKKHYDQFNKDFGIGETNL